MGSMYFKHLYFDEGFFHCFYEPNIKVYGMVRRKGTQIMERYQTTLVETLYRWQGPQSELLTFIEHLNKAHPNIKFTSTYNKETKTIPFLDMQVTIDEEGIIQTDLYTKDTARALLPQSCHPGHITQNIPFSRALRLL